MRKISSRTSSPPRVVESRRGHRNGSAIHRLPFRWRDPKRMRRRTSHVERPTPALQVEDAIASASQLRNPERPSRQSGQRSRAYLRLAYVRGRVGVGRVPDNSWGDYLELFQRLTVMLSSSIGYRVDGSPFGSLLVMSFRPIEIVVEPAVAVENAERFPRVVGRRRLRRLSMTRQIPQASSCLLLFPRLCRETLEKDSEPSLSPTKHTRLALLSSSHIRMTWHFRRLISVVGGDFRRLISVESR